MMYKIFTYAYNAKWKCNMNRSPKEKHVRGKGTHCQIYKPSVAVALTAYQLGIAQDMLSWQCEVIIKIIAVEPFSTAYFRPGQDNLPEREAILLTSVYHMTVNVWVKVRLNCFTWGRIPLISARLPLSMMFKAEYPVVFSQVGNHDKHAWFSTNVLILTNLYVLHSISL